MKHTKTDPVCVQYKETGPFRRHLNGRGRGKACLVCVPQSWIRQNWHHLPADALYCNPHANLHLNCGHVDEIGPTK